MRRRRMSRAWLVLFIPLTSIAVEAQIALSTLTGTTETPVTSSYTFAPMAPYATEDVTFRVRGTGNAPVTVTQLALSGIGFAIVNTSTLPVTIAAGNAFDFFVRFTGGPIGSFSANLQVNTLIVSLAGSVVQAATVSAAAPCTGPDSQGIISFGRIPQTTQVACVITLANLYTQELAVSPLTITGAGFQAPLPSQPAIPAGQSITFTVTFTAATATTFNATLIVGVQTLYLVGTGYLSPLPAPVLSFGSATLQSGQQYSLTASLPSPAQAATTGTILMSFTPWTTAIVDDATVHFVSTSKRVVSFSVAQGSTALLLNNQSSAFFSTGTSAGTITFTVDAGVIGLNGSATTTATIAPAPITVTQATATPSTTGLEVSMTGFDNTYTAGHMSFTFYDRSGNRLGAPIQADFTPQFENFYQGPAKGMGSAFQMLVSFPATGNIGEVGSVVVQLTNTAGSVTVSGLNFPMGP